MRPHLIAILGYVAATFATQATSHFFLFKDHYAAVPYIKAEPIFALGFLSMIIQGAVLSFVYVNLRFRAGSLFQAAQLAWAFGAF